MIGVRRASLGIREVLQAMGTGAARSQFEAAVAEKAGARFGLSFIYGHSGLLALLRSMELNGAEVIVPAFTSQVVAETVIGTGNRPVFVDIDLADFNMDLNLLEKAITPRTRVIVATHLFGYPASLPGIREIAAGQNIAIIEDSAHSYPGTTRGPDGLQGDAAFFSLGPGKPLFTVRGGMVVTNDQGLYEKMLSYRDREMSAITRQEWFKRWALLGAHYLLSKPALFDIADYFHLTSKSALRTAFGRPPGYGVGSTDPRPELPPNYATGYADFQARIGLAQLEKADWMLSRRRANANLYSQLLAGIPGMVPAPLVQQASYTHYSVRVPDKESICFREKLLARGIETGRTFNYTVPGLKNRPYYGGSYPHAEQASREIANLPVYPDLTDEQIRKIAQEIHSVMTTATHISAVAR